MDRVARLRRAVEIWNEGDYEGFEAFVGADVVFSPDPRFPEQGPFTGEQFHRFLEGWLETWGGDAELAADEVTERGDAVLMRARWVVRGASSGAYVPAAFTFVVWMNPDGTFDRLLAFFDHEDALAAADAGREAAG